MREVQLSPASGAPASDLGHPLPVSFFKVIWCLQNFEEGADVETQKSLGKGTPN